MNSNYLQSLAWQKVCQASGSKTIILEDEEFFSLLIEKQLKFFGSYYYCPRGPIFKDKENWLNVLKTWLSTAKQGKIPFIKLDPSLVDIGLFKETCQSLGIEIRKVQSIQPQQTAYLNLELSEEELLKQMKPKTRYNIRVALKHDLDLVEDNNDFEEFFKLLSATKDRDAFRLHPKAHYLNLINNGIKLISIKKDDIMLAGGLFSFYQDTATYLHGASNYKERSKMAPYLLHFEIIKKAKAMNLKYYDFYGIDEKRWPGVTRFKKGFGGTELNYPDSYDLIFNRSSYFLYHILKKIKRSLRWK